MAETAGGHWDVLRGYLYVAVDLGPLAAQAGLPPGGDICGKTFPDILGGYETAGHPPTRMGGTVEMFENLSPQVPGNQRVEGAGGGVADEVKVADLLCDDAQTWAGTESLNLWAEDLAEGHILEIEGRSVSDGCADPDSPGGGCRQVGQRVRYHVRHTWYIHQLVGVL
jgi:hypothetical protein